MSVGAPGGTRTHDLQVRNLTLYPLSYGRMPESWQPECSAGACSPKSKAELRDAIGLRKIAGGEGGIRTLGAGYPTQRFSNSLAACRRPSAIIRQRPPRTNERPGASSPGRSVR